MYANLDGAAKLLGYMTEAFGITQTQGCPKPQEALGPELLAKSYITSHRIRNHRSGDKII